jgi:hypothetical protein
MAIFIYAFVFALQVMAALACDSDGDGYLMG